MDAIQAKINTWLNGRFDQQTKDEIIRLQKENPEQLADAFYKDLEFGTGGLRGIMGVGTNRMNKYTVGMATQGYANYLKQSFPNDEVRVAIAHDSRNNSRFFAETTANVFAANGIKVFLFDSLRPTPELSFAIRYLKCQGGVVCTASHNPKEYNGYKAYWTDGGQLVPPHDKNVIKEVERIGSVDNVKWGPPTLTLAQASADKPAPTQASAGKPATTQASASKAGDAGGNSENITIIGQEIDEEYMKMVKGLSVYPEIIQKQHDLTIVYTPIHGSGIKLVPEVLKRFGFTNVHIVKEQMEPDGNFPTVAYPNPEEKETMSIGLQNAQELDADILLGTDPDSDRVGIGVKDNHGDWVLMNGNQTAVLAFNYLIEARKAKGIAKPNDMVIKTIVTTEMIDKIAQHNGVKCYNVLTGFKWIAEMIREKEGKENYVIGGEESFGLMIGDKIRDKDAVSAVALLCEMAAYEKEKGRSLFEKMIDLYLQYGFYLEDLISITKKGMDGQKQIAAMMEDFRNNPPKMIDGLPVVELLDYEKRVGRNLATDESWEITLPKSNVLQFVLASGDKISARPSGTEPKIKFYFSVNAKLESPEEFDTMQEHLQKKIQRIIDEMNLRS